MIPTSRAGLLFGAILVLLGPQARTLPAQTVLGITWENLSGRSLPGVRVLVRGPGGEDVGHPGALSGPDGRFELDLGEMAGPVILLGQKVGYAGSGPVPLNVEDITEVLEVTLELQDLSESRAAFSLRESGAVGQRTARVLGWVRERHSGRPIQTAQVTVLQTGQATTTDGNGMFVLDGIPPGEIALAIEHLSFAPEGHLFRTEPGQAYEVQATMTPDAIPMEGIEVSVRSRTWYRQMDGLRVRMQTGLRGDFITADEIEARGYPPVEETIRSLPGVRIIKASPFEYDVRFRSCEQAPVVFVDGIQVNQPEDGEPLRELRMIHSMDIQAVEIYRGAASVPAEFGGPDAMCGALVIWTKRSG